MINLHVQPHVAPKTWEDFCRTAPEFSIALDGYVQGPPEFDPDRMHLSLNHHEGVDRLATRSTCAQVLICIRQGLFDSFRDEVGPRAKVFVNDCDEDVCLSWFLLKNHHLAESAMNPAINRLVALEDAMDATAGAYPFPADLPALGELAWVFEPYRWLRVSGALEHKDQASFEGVIEDVSGRIMKMILGQGKSLPLDTRYERIGGGPGWAMVKEVGAQARTGMFADGIRAYVSVRERPNGHWTYTVGRMSQFIRFPVKNIMTVLCGEELAARGGYLTTDTWGGGDMIGGSPRVSGSLLPPELVEKIVNKTLGFHSVNTSSVAIKGLEG